MNTEKQHRTEPWILMQLRRFGGGNPLRRGVDRMESLLLLGTVLAALLAIPAAAILGTAVRNSSEHSAAQRRAELWSVQARTLEDTRSAVPAAPGQLTSGVRAAWVDEDGFPQEGRAHVVIGTKAGSEVTVWLDRSGAVVPAPRLPADSAAFGVAAGLSALMLGWPLLWGLFRLASVPLDRRRSADWEREWAATAPRWTQSQH